jgi:hypothetical protein
MVIAIWRAYCAQLWLVLLSSNIFWFMHICGILDLIFLSSTDYVLFIVDWDVEWNG